MNDPVVAKSSTVPRYVTAKPRVAYRVGDAVYQCWSGQIPMLLQVVKVGRLYIEVRDPRDRYYSGGGRFNVQDGIESGQYGHSWVLTEAEFREFEAPNRPTYSKNGILYCAKCCSSECPLVTSHPRLKSCRAEAG